MKKLIATALLALAIAAPTASADAAREATLERSLANATQVLVQKSRNGQVSLPRLCEHWHTFAAVLQPIDRAYLDSEIKRRRALLRH